MIMVVTDRQSKIFKVKFRKHNIIQAYHKRPASRRKFLYGWLIKSTTDVGFLPELPTGPILTSKRHDVWIVV